MNIVNLQTKSKVLAGSLSHGQKQWLEIAMLVGQDPDMLLVDEPVAGLTDEEELASGWFMQNARLPANIHESDSETPWLTTQMINYLKLENEIL